MTVLANRLLRIRAYYAVNSTNISLYSSYFLLGYRKNFIFFRLVAICDQVRRSCSFLQKCFAVDVRYWAVCDHQQHSRFLWWLASYAKLNLVISMRNGVFAFLWKGRCFMARVREVNNRILQFAGIEGLVVLGNGDLSDFGLLYVAKAVPVIGLVPPSVGSWGSTFAFHVAISQPALLVFYSRLIVLFMTTRLV